MPLMRSDGIAVHSLWRLIFIFRFYLLWCCGICTLVIRVVRVLEGLESLVELVGPALLLTVAIFVLIYGALFFSTTAFCGALLLK